MTETASLTEGERERAFQDIAVELTNRIGAQRLSADLVRGVVREWERVTSPSGSLTWADMRDLPAKSIVLFDGRPFQKTRENMGVEDGEPWQFWHGAGSASLNQAGVDEYAPSPVILIYRPDTP